MLPFIILKKGVSMKKLLRTISLLIIMIFTCSFTTPNINETGRYSTIKEDFEAWSFNYSLLNRDPSNQSISVLQLIEKDLDLYLYLYDPSNQLIAAYANPKLNVAVYEATSEEALKTEKATYYSLDMELISDLNDSACLKYKISKVASLSYRRYSLVTIRTGTTTSNYKAYSLAKDYYYWTDANKQVNYYYKELETITITAQKVYSLAIRTNSAWSDLVFYRKGSQNFFIGFNTNRKIDELIEIEMQYTAQEYTQTTDANGFVIRDNQPATLVNNVVSGFKKTVTAQSWFQANKYSWDTVSTYSALMNNNNTEFKSFITSNFQNYNHIVNFAQYSYQSTTSNFITKGTAISNIEILRLKFEYDGVIYDLSAVSVPISSSGNDFINPEIDDFFKELIALLCKVFGINEKQAKIIIGIAIAAAVLLIVVPVLSFIGKLLIPRRYR